MKMQRIGLFLGLVVVLGGNMALMGFADCTTEHDSARAAVLNLKQRALAGESLDAEAEAHLFQAHLGRLQLGQCQHELLELVQFIQQEQNMIPVANPVP